MPISKNPFSDLKDKQELHEHSFVSSVPVVGPFIVWFRTTWNNVATRWYVRPLIQQQNAFNQELILTVENLLQQIEERLSALEQIAADLDIDQVTLARDVAEIRYQVICAHQEIETLSQRATTDQHRTA
jgi:hypothetical protein